MDKPKSRRSFNSGRHKDFSTSDFYRNTSWKKERYYKKNQDVKNEKHQEAKYNITEEYQYITSNSFNWLKNCIV